MPKLPRALGSEVIRALQWLGFEKVRQSGSHVLIVTHVHIDHVGRIPYLLEAGYQGPIFCSEASALLLPLVLVLEDALKAGFTRNQALIERVLGSPDRNAEHTPQCLDIGR